MAQISCNKVSMGYDKRLVLHDISFDIQQGDYLCIVGENGSGKTTLMKGILGLLPLKSGSITFGEGVKSTEIGYLPQQIMLQKDFPASVFEVVMSGCLNRMGGRPFYSSKEKKRALDNLDRLELKALKNRPFSVLSGGQQQRVLLARALCATEKILLLDEPAAGLDPIVTSELYHIIKELNRVGITVVMISHDMQAAMQNANLILHINKTAEFFGTAADYKNSRSGTRFLGSVDEPPVFVTGGGVHA